MPIFNASYTFSHDKLVAYTQRNLLEILLNQTEIRLYLPFSIDLDVRKSMSVAVPNQSENSKYNLISV